MGKMGRNKEVSDKQILQAIALHPDPIVTSSEVAESVDMTKQGVNKRLNELAEEEYVVRKSVGARAVVY
jgi:predicted transcriptional regulator